VEPVEPRKTVDLAVDSTCHLDTVGVAEEVSRREGDLSAGHDA